MAESKRIVCISHFAGAEGEAVAREVAERLGFRYLDEEIIETAAESVDLHPSVVGDVERRKSLMSRLGELMRGQSGSPRPDAAPERRSGAAVRELPTSEDLRAVIRDAIRDAADEGEIVIASHAASITLAGRTDTLRVLVTASPQTRAKRIAGTRSLDARQAEKAQQEEDAARADYLMRFHGVDREQPTHYDLVLNTDNVPAERAAELVVLAAGRA
jgi:cytidylate kinase